MEFSQLKFHLDIAIAIAFCAERNGNYNSIKPFLSGFFFFLFPFNSLDLLSCDVQQGIKPKTFIV